MTTIPLGEFAMNVPGFWKAVAPSSPMRVAQFEWPSMKGDSEAPQLIVFFFGPGSGGGVEANLERWRGQFDDGGKPNPGRTETIASGAAKITYFDKSGTYKLQPSMMSPEFTPKPKWRMLAAVVEIEGGPYYFRATGPEASAAAQRDAFIAAIKSFRRAGG